MLHRSSTSERSSFFKKGSVLLVLVLLLWSPLPEIFLGNWLLRTNTERPQQGAGHLRHGRVVAGQQVADSLGRFQQGRQQQQGLVLSLPRLRRHLLRYEELRLSWGAFLELYSNLPDALAEELLSHSDLKHFEFDGPASEVLFQRHAIAPLNCRVTFLKGGERVLGREIDLDTPSFQAYSLSLYTFLSVDQQFDDPSFKKVALDSLSEDSLLSASTLFRLRRYSFQPSVEVATLWQGPERWLVECVDEGRHVFLSIDGTDVPILSDSISDGAKSKMKWKEWFGN
jgi:hypothetical protein